MVTPSRVCELKSGDAIKFVSEMESHPHGCVSWNVQVDGKLTVTLYVTPSRVCELKSSWFEAYASWCPSHTLTGVWVEISGFLKISLVKAVTPSRVCELKSLWGDTEGIFKSHPHGCVSWNSGELNMPLLLESHPHGCVSWNSRIQISYCVFIRVTPSRVCELKLPGRRDITTSVVTPSRVCELKYEALSNSAQEWGGHTLTGVWVEISLWRFGVARLSMSHTLTGVWVEISLMWYRLLRAMVTPSRVCELKF